MTTLKMVYPEKAAYPCPKCLEEGVRHAGRVIGDDQWTQELVLECQKHGMYIVPHVYPELVEA